VSFIEQSIDLGCLAIGVDVYGRKDGSEIFSISFPVGKKFAYELSYISAWEMKNSDSNITLYLVEDKMFVVGKNALESK